MSIYRKPFKNRQGEQQWCRYYSARFVDHTGRNREVSTQQERKPLAREVLRQLQLLVQHHRAAMPLPKELMNWVSRQHPAMRQKLGEWHLIPAEQTAAMAPIANLLERWEVSIRTKGATEKHAQETRKKVQHLFDLTRVTFWTDLEAPTYPVLETLVAMDLHTTTKKAYWTAVVSFCRWGQRVMNVPPPRLMLAQPKFKAQPTDANKGRKRRTASPHEIDAVIDAALVGGEQHGIPGDGWALAYELAVQTGFRVNEIATITPKACKLDTLPHHITITAANAKSRKQRGCDIRPQLAQRIRDYIARHKIGPEASILPLNNQRTARVLRLHLAAASVPFKNEQGEVFDFHAFRHTFLTNIARSTDIATAQKLAGHASASTTMGYLHTTALQQRQALDKLPEIRRLG